MKQGKEKLLKRMERLLEETERLKDEITEIAEAVKDFKGLQVELLPHLRKTTELINRIETGILILKKDLTKEIV